MDLPSAREIELETLLRQRDAHIADLTDEVTHLRQHLSTNPPSASTDPISLPPALVSLLLPHINERAVSGATSSNTVTAALTQRVKVLQDENDELYELLKTGETGRLKDDVRALQRVVQKLESALRESHQAITTLSEELDKSQAAILANNKPNSHMYTNAGGVQPSSHLPTGPAQHASAALISRKPPPTAPRAHVHKKPRLSEGNHMSPAVQAVPLPPQKMENRSHSGSTTRRHDSRERSPPRKSAAGAVKMEVDADEERRRPKSAERARVGGSGEAQRDSRKREGGGGGGGGDRNRARDRDRNRDRDRASRRNGGAASASASGGNGNGGGSGNSSGGGGGARRNQWNGNGSNGAANNNSTGADRTLAERMGL
ncbi:hypothetical protein EUX98_g1251 [Antrodiella citrinella]|uniref:Uncharacterized protein n=1 Tax=Antrodiella citrinella TaxID=2447956 RepID=A0A4S4NAI7_9APHY|nr:hypothetical protein EUX98_g1251 [Antrodiella citrinella]